jgi:hypothetical protein
MPAGRPIVPAASASIKGQGASAYPVCVPQQAVLISHSDGSGTWSGIREVRGRYIPGPSARGVKPPAGRPGPEAPPRHLVTRARLRPSLQHKLRMLTGPRSRWSRPIPRLVWTIALQVSARIQHGVRKRREIIGMIRTNGTREGASNSAAERPAPPEVPR